MIERDLLYGAWLALEQTGRLLQSAAILFDSGDHPTAFVLAMQTFLNIAVWVWLAEIFPLEMRGLAFGISAFFGWFVNGLLALYVPTLLATLGMGTFFLFAVIGVVMLGFLWHEVPETRGRTLESLEEDLLSGERTDLEGVLPHASPRKLARKACQSKAPSRMNRTSLISFFVS